MDIDSWDEFTTLKAIDKLNEHYKQLQEAKLAEKCSKGHKTLHLYYQADSNTVSIDCTTCQRDFITKQDMTDVLETIKGAELLPF